MNASDISQLRGLAAEVSQKYDPVLDDQGRQRPWDIEFGFVDGQLTLFQIRPLVEKNAQRTDLIMTRFRPVKSAAIGHQVYRAGAATLAGAKP